jgi:hypothetical protein
VVAETIDMSILNKQNTTKMSGNIADNVCIVGQWAAWLLGVLMFKIKKICIGYTCVTCDRAWLASI